MTDNPVSLHYLPPFKLVARKLADQLDLPCHEIAVHRFPDGESKLRVQPVAGSAIIYASLDHPDDKLVQLAFAASALRQSGVTRLVLVAPYLCYMRQDKAFTRGEAVSQRIIGEYLSGLFDRVVTVDPHLHRIGNLQDIFTNCQADSLSATSCIVAALKQEENQNRLLFVGPDMESEQWVGSIAKKLNAPFIVAAKSRHGDREVQITFSDPKAIKGARAIIIDDIISTGTTLCRCAMALQDTGAVSIEAIAVHALSNQTDIEAMKQAGISHLQSTDSVLHSTNSISLAPLLAAALKEEIHNDH